MRPLLGDFVLSALSFRPLAIGCVLLFAGFATAADGDKGAVYTEPPADDANYNLLGEFVGPIATGENEYESLGLQVRPVGGDNFEAVQFRGGLPGQDKHQQEGVKLVGRRSGDFVVLSGGPWAIFVEDDECLILDREGKQVGRLQRVSRQSPTLGAAAPEEAMVLFDGTGTDHFSKAEMTDDGLLMAGADLKPMFQDFDLHAEFRLPYMPAAAEQGRANSGVYLQSRYECQVLDSFGQDRLFNGCGALYRFRKPDVNMCFPPLVWQTYDIRFTAPRWAADGSKLRNAHITAWLNGVKVQDNVELPNKTGAGKQEEPLLLPIRLQDHGDPVRYRNVWVIDRGLNTAVDFPVQATDKPAKEAKQAKQEKKASEKKASEKKASEKKASEKKASQEKSAQEAKSDAKKPDAKKKSAPKADKANEKAEEKKGDEETEQEAGSDSDQASE